MPVRKLIFHNYLPPGDNIAMECVIHALHQTHPGAFLTDVRSKHPQIFENNPNICPVADWEGQHVPCDYTRGIQSSGNGNHFYRAYADCVSSQIGVHIEVSELRGHVYLTEEEKSPFPGLPDRYIVVNPLYKRDFTAKMWSTSRYQQVVDALKDKYAFVQTGSCGELGEPLNGAINLIGKTDIRQLSQVIYGSSLVISPVSFPMHLSAAIPDKDGKVRPCIVLAGQREQRSWEQLNGHIHLGTVGPLSCGIGHGEACWASKTVRSDASGRPCSCYDNECRCRDEPCSCPWRICQCDKNICRSVKLDEAGKAVPECLHRISAHDVIQAIESYGI